MALSLRAFIKSGKKSTPVIFPVIFCARTIVCPPVPQPKSTTREVLLRLSRKLNALIVISGLPGPCRSNPTCNSQIKFMSKSCIDVCLFTILYLSIQYNIDNVRFSLSQAHTKTHHLFYRYSMLKATLKLKTVASTTPSTNATNSSHRGNLQTYSDKRFLMTITIKTARPKASRTRLQLLFSVLSIDFRAVPEPEDKSAIPAYGRLVNDCKP